MMNDKKTSPSDFTWIKRSIDLFLDRDEDGLASSSSSSCEFFSRVRSKLKADIEATPGANFKSPLDDVTTAAEVISLLNALHKDFRGEGGVKLSRAALRRFTDGDVMLAAKAALRALTASLVVQQAYSA